MARVLLLVPTSTYRAPDFMRAAAALGVGVVVGSERPQAMAAAMGDRALVVPLGDPDAAVDAIEALHRRAPVDAVVGVDDQGVVVAARAGERLGLVHNPPHAAEATRDKLLMRQRFSDAGVPQPRWHAAGVADDVAAVAAEVGLPCVIKPVGLSASQGVIRVDSAAEAVVTARRVRRIAAAAGADPDGPLLVERFVPGAEVALEGMVVGGRLSVLAVFDKPDPLDGPYFEETMFVTPSRLGLDQLDLVGARTIAAVDAVGLRGGPVHAELRVDAGHVTMLEVAARTIGGLCARTLRFGVGVSLEELVLRHALGLTIEVGGLEPGAAGVLMVPIPGAGVLEAVTGQEAAARVPGIVGVEMSLRSGTEVVPLPEGNRYLGFVFARGRRPEEVERSLRAAQACLEVRLRLPGE